MTNPLSSRLILDVSSRLEHYLVPVPSGGEAVCSVCHSVTHDGYRTCYPCHQARLVLSDSCLDATACVSLAPKGTQLARDLFTYKRANVPARHRRERLVGLSALLWRWLWHHERCLATQAGSSDFDLVTTVPSTSGRNTEHPLTVLVAGIVHGTQQRTRSVLSRNRTDVAPREQAADRFVATPDVRGLDVLIVDDTWTTGATIQSASAAVKQAGANKVAGVAIGRWFHPEYRDNTAWLAEAKRARWSWQTCCLE